METAQQNQAAKICYLCGLPILDMFGVFALNHSYHREHFRCTACNQPIRLGKNYLHNRQPYCPKDFQRLFTRKCARCSGAIMGRAIQVERFKKKIYFHPKCFRCRKCHEAINQQLYIIDDFGNTYCGVCQIGRDHCEYCDIPLPYIRHRIDRHGVPICDDCFKNNSKKPGAQQSVFNDDDEQNNEESTRKRVPLDRLEIFDSTDIDDIFPDQVDKHQVVDDIKTGDSQKIPGGSQKSGGSQKTKDIPKKGDKSQKNDNSRKVNDSQKIDQKAKKSPKTGKSQEKVDRKESRKSTDVDIFEVEVNQTDAKSAFELTQPDKRIVSADELRSRLKEIKNQERIQQEERENHKKRKERDDADLEDHYRNLLAVEQAASGVDDLYRLDRGLSVVAKKDKSQKKVAEAYLLEYNLNHLDITDIKSEKRDIDTDWYRTRNIGKISMEDLGNAKNLEDLSKFSDQFLKNTMAADNISTKSKEILDDDIRHGGIIHSVSRYVRVVNYDDLAVEEFDVKNLE